MTGVGAVPLIVNILVCDCNGHGICNWDPVGGYNRTDSYQIVHCDCDEPPYYSKKY